MEKTVFDSMDGSDGLYHLVGGLMIPMENGRTAS
jgi:hypothetical protein